MLKRLLLTAVLLCSLPLQAAQDRLLIWKVSTAGSTTWLLGSMHLARTDIYPLREAISQAFASADTLVVELDISGPAEFAIQQKMLTRGTYSNGQTISDQLSPATWKELSRRLQDSGLPPMMMEQLKPGLVVTTLTTIEMMKLGLSPELGVDRYFLNLARGSKRIVELETIDQQIDLLLDFPDSELLVRQTLQQMDTLEQSLNELVRHWRQGDAAALQKLVLDDELRRNPEFRPLHERMFDQRNRAMTQRIVELQRGGGQLFVVVGAGHLLGDQGIVALLKKRGQKPQQL